MQIVFVLNNLYPNGKASTARVRSYGKGFLANGIRVKVLLPIPKQRFTEHPLNPNNEGQDENGVRYKYMAHSSVRSKSIIIRQIQDIYGYLHTLFHILFKSQADDLFIIYEGSPLWYNLCVTVAHIAKRKIGIELNELPYGTGKETDKTIKQRHYMLRKIFPKIDFILAISEELEKLGQKYAPQAITIKVPIIIDGDLSGEENKEKNIPYIFHSGSLFEQKDGICGMIEAFGIACQYINKPIEYILTGNLEDSPHSNEIKRIINKYNIQDRIKFLGYLDIQSLRRYQKDCFLTIINKYDTQQNKYCFSTKLGEYLSFSRPVITTTIGEANHYLKDGINAFIVEPHHPDLIAKKIIYAFEHPEESHKIGIAGHKLVEKEFNCIYQTKRIINALKLK